MALGFFPGSRVDNYCENVFQEGDWRGCAPILYETSKKSSVTILIPSKQMLQYINLLDEWVPNRKYYKLIDISQGVEQEVK